MAVRIPKRADACPLCHCPPISPAVNCRAEHGYAVERAEHACSPRGLLLVTHRVRSTLRPDTAPPCSRRRSARQFTAGDRKRPRCRRLTPNVEIAAREYCRRPSPTHRGVTVIVLLGPPVPLRRRRPTTVVSSRHFNGGKRVAPSRRVGIRYSVLGVGGRLPFRTPNT